MATERNSAIRAVLASDPMASKRPAAWKRKVDCADDLLLPTMPAVGRRVLLLLSLPVR
jgi:hypothetical protein